MRWWPEVLGIALASLFVPSLARAQYLFGQNKVVYDARSWAILSTPHLDLYYYREEADLAAYVADFAERTCVEYETYFRHPMRAKIPLVLYASHHDFKQTNVIDAMISEYVGGFTEYLRGRVAIPHTGSMTQLRTVTRHELVHAFVNDKLAAIGAEHHRFDIASPPLWFMEGLAEYVAAWTPDTEARMFMRDLVNNDRLVEMPDLWRISGTFLMYKEGESLCGYIATRFGDAALVQFLDTWWMAGGFDDVLRRTLGISETELNRDWKRFLKRRYAPAVLEREWPDQRGEPLTHGPGIHSRPAPAFDPTHAGGERDFVFLSSDSGTLDLVYARAEATSADGHPQFRYEPLVRGGRNERFESFPAFASGLEVHGRRVAFTCKAGSHDALVLWDLDAPRESRRFQFTDLVALGSPTWSPDGSEIVFVGLDRSGWPDLYRLHLESGERTRLTHDSADDRDPCWSHDGTRIAWSTDRGSQDANGVAHLWVLELATRTARALTSGEEMDAAPRWSPDDRALLFTSDASGTNDVYLCDLETQGLTRLTASLGGLFTPQWTPDGKGFMASSFGELAFNVFRFDLGSANSVPPAAAVPQIASSSPVPAGDEVDIASSRGTPAPPGRDWIVGVRGARFPSRAYGVRFGLDFVRTAVALDPDFVSAAGGQVGLSDMLGNHQIAIYGSDNAQTLSEFWRHLSLGLTYTNLSHRLNYSLGVFHLTSDYDARTDRFRWERRYGVLGGVAYPLSRFRRVESTFVVRIVERDASEAALFGVGTQSLLGSNFTSFVHDNTLWSMTGPVDGTRFNVTVGYTADLSGTRRGGSSLQFDCRSYRPLPGRAVLAGRIASRNSWGPDVQYSYLGGPFDLRGYQLRSLFARHTLLTNGELRFPLLDRLLVGLPFHALDLGGFRGALFGDAAYVGVPYSDWYGSFGMGFEMWLGPGFVARLDVGRIHDFHVVAANTFTHFFLGWDF